MLQLILGSFFVLFIWQVAAQAEYGTSKIEESCQRDYHCIKHAFCRAQKTCLCEPNYAPSPDKSMCIATIGLLCTDSETCSTMANGECKQGVCACKETFTVDIRNSSNCIPRPTEAGAFCQRNDDCTDTLDRAMCINEKCQCLTHHHFAAEVGRCVRSRGLYENCMNSYECYWDRGDVDMLECRNGECSCKQGVPSNDRLCSSGATTIATVATTFVYFAIRMIF